MDGTPNQRAHRIAWRWTIVYAALAALVLAAYLLRLGHDSGPTTGRLGLTLLALGLPWSVTEFQARGTIDFSLVLLGSLGLNALLLFHGVRRLAQRRHPDHLPDER